MLRENREPNHSLGILLELHQGVSHFTNGQGVPFDKITAAGQGYAAVMRYPTPAERESIPRCVRDFTDSIFPDAPIFRIAFTGEREDPTICHYRNTILIDVQENSTQPTLYGSQVEVNLDNLYCPNYFITRVTDERRRGETGFVDPTIVRAVAFMLPDTKERAQMSGYEEFFPYSTCTSQEPVKELIRYRGRMY